MFTRGVLATALLLAAAPAASAQAVAQADVQRELQRRIENMRTTGALRVGGTSLPASAVIATLYEQRGFSPVWTEPRGAALLQALESLKRDGLDPDAYHLRQLTAVAPDARSAAELDLLRSVALLTAAQHLRYGRVDAASLRPRRDLDRTIHGTDIVLDAAQLLAMQPAAALESVRPAHFVYRGLADALQRMERLQELGGRPDIPQVRMALDSSGPAVLLLRRRLVLEGDMPVTELRGDSVDAVFDGAMDAGVRRFQHRHALNEDGVVGPATLRELNVPLSTRINQVRVNLERARWVVHELPPTFVVVNVAGAIVYFVRDGVDIFESRVIVGKPFTTTPVFMAQARYIELNPYWTVPPGIVGEVLAHVRRDAGYLQREGMRVVDHAGRTVSPTGIDFARYSGRSFPWTFRQDPGPRNPLGRIKIMFPNRHNVYLHDTPSRQLFEREERLFSHGCIRVEQPVELAALVLDDPAWDVDRLRAAIATGTTRTVQLRRPVTVLVQYWTAGADRHGELHLYRDVYGRDAAVQAALGAR